jgi:hypothetical protein
MGFSDIQNQLAVWSEKVTNDSMYGITMRLLLYYSLEFAAPTAIN